MFAAAVVAVTVGLTVVGCTGDDPETGATTPTAGPSSAPALSMTFDEASRKLPMDGTKELPITWEVSAAEDTDEVLAARRGLAFLYWERASTDWAPMVALGPYFHTDKYFQASIAPYASGAETNPMLGHQWFKLMGVEKAGADEATVTFCGDIGLRRRADEKTVPARPKRWNLESYVVKNVMTGDGESHWLVDDRNDNDTDREGKYGAQCEAWAQHKD